MNCINHLPGAQALARGGVDLWCEVPSLPIIEACFLQVKSAEYATVTLEGIYIHRYIEIK